MKYFEELDAWLTAVLLGGPEEEDVDEEAWLDRIKKQLKEKILESYRNGQKAGLKSVEKSGDDKPRQAKKNSWWPPRRKA